MRILLQPIPEAFEILKRDNPTKRFHLNKHGIALQLASTDWAWIVSTGYDNKVRVFGPGENTLTMTDEWFTKLYLETEGA